MTTLYLRRITKTVEIVALDCPEATEGMLKRLANPDIAGTQVWADTSVRHSTQGSDWQTTRAENTIEIVAYEHEGEIRALGTASSLSIGEAAIVHRLRK